MTAKLPAWERKQLAIRAKLRRMLKKTPKKITGRHVYAGEHLRRAAIESRSLKKGRARMRMQRVMRLHGGYWRDLSPQRLFHELQGVRDASTRELASKASSMNLSSCKLTDAELKQVDALRSSKEWTQSRVRDLRKACTECPVKANDHEVEAWITSSQLHNPHHEPLSLSMQQCLRHREALKCGVLCCMHSDGSECFYRFLFGLQRNPSQPLLLRVSQIRLPPTRPYTSVASWDELSLADYSLMWTFQAGDYEHTDVLADADVLEVGVVLRTTFKATGVLVSKDVVQPLESVLQALETDAPETTRGTEQTHSAQNRKRSTQHTMPKWLQNLNAAGASASASSHVPLDVAVPSDEDALSEVSADEAMSLACAEVVADHAVLETSESTLHECFRMQLIGGRGAGSSDRLGMNGLRVEVRSTTVVHYFCKLMGMHL
eukprot:667659-Amphidinium_carterae.1